ncbi:MAG: hypothetical protein A3B74_00970 [Candidatus Kerfeldbacteria bacterium RIFCSPHIGHO2_02_FULL_42_14]|uniref:NADPH-dependent FMN reductase-like domain-containing protein n=1 Tax=Candidatus Kerfeldbacteria bacterium RIFCSPHIGHO2_02_FULL_42_14 TaxID=1798540 RepID=A0A1G2ATT5_9BACT|nr:MAG: hypothetical protein A3B74_00970 [Candidatus Kerfeldbacteria bacterium RIFCSPHIGHO2_02_FULL_42_14]OGY81925.1 MAG: hypothetical protein A3E60_01050 [Candidatus Kerfeldbacteria bacterium RIFCSPHIGHO2_12_FULL_42_13]OGY83440.1 MAG: hypothetical protein A3I91_02205 [Candidatus Kerfeldbacteria bacterium RIFCSPLOWO2_02_FULL_42_19]OGY87034.1 MAG: hypothetical protein A3G01_02005 [Candidatus Kerfeldbacteria bacterium RIFCSPLOWO2_12_FULL_43_9]
MIRKFFLPILLGTGRQGRYSEYVVRFLLSEVQRYPLLKTQLIDVRNFAPVRSRTDSCFTVPSWEPTNISRQWSAIMKRADGLIVVSPEYNHGYPGELKIVLDEIFDEYARKPVALCGVSSGGLGGARVVEQLRLVFAALGMVSIKNALYFSYVEKLFDKRGELQDKSYIKHVRTTLDELVWYARALRVARKNV